MTSEWLTTRGVCECEGGPRSRSRLKVSLVFLNDVWVPPEYK